MPTEKFPLDPTQVVGRFWLANTGPAAWAPGVCRVEDDVIEMDLSSALFPWMEMKEVVNGVSIQQSVEEEPDSVVHGRLPIAPGYVTFLGARTANRKTLLPTELDDLELHRLHAEWCIAGIHVDSVHTKYSGFRARFTHLEPWASTPGVTMTLQHSPPPTKATYEYAPSEELKAPFDQFGENATLRVGQAGTIRPPTAWGAALETINWLELTGLGGWTLEEGLARFVQPIRLMLTLAAQQACDITHLEVRIDNNWYPVYGSAVRASSARATQRDILFTRSVLPLELLAPWCGLVTQTSPTPHVVASATAGEFTTIQSQALALTTTAEGLDRVLHPDARRFSADDVDVTVAAMRDMPGLPDDVRTAIINALGQYFYEPSYPMRMGSLAEDVAAAVPGCIGKPNKWKHEIANLRIGLAHSLDTSSSNEELSRTYARVLTLRWALTVRLLLEVGVDDTALRESLENSERYGRDARVWLEHMPKTFADT